MSTIPLARSNDPATSHQAAEELLADGTLGEMESLAYSLVLQYPGRTANELEAMRGLKDGQVRKRLDGLRHRGLVEPGEARQSTVTGKMNQTWYVANGRNVAKQLEMF